MGQRWLFGSVVFAVAMWAWALWPPTLQRDPLPLEDQWVGETTPPASEAHRYRHFVVTTKGGIRYHCWGTHYVWINALQIKDAVRDQAVLTLPSSAVAAIGEQ